VETGKYVGQSLPDECVPQVAVIRDRPECGAAAGATRRVDWQKIIGQAGELAQAMPARQERLVDLVPVATRERREFSFSRLHGSMHVRERTDEALDEEPERTQPARGRIDALGLGTLVHAALAEIRFGDPVDVPALVRRHAEQHVSVGGDEHKLAESLVAKFVASPRARQLAAAKQDLVELEFLLAWPPGGDEADRLQLVGFIDRLYQDRDGDWHILDFKTNRVDAATLAAVAANYELQMYVYALAAEQALGRPPKTLTLHMLRTGQEYPFEWNDAARTRVRTMVDDAIARLREPAA